MGTLRENFGLHSAGYGDWFFTGTHRLGLTDWITGEIRGEFSERFRAAGAALTSLVDEAGIVNLSLATSRGQLGQGGLLDLGFERQTDILSFGLQTRFASARFDRFSRLPGQRVPRRELNAHLGWDSGKAGSFGLGYIHRDNRGQPDNKLLSANYQQRLGRGWSLGLSAFKSLDESDDYALGFILTRPLGERRSLNVSGNRRDGGADDLQVQLQRNLPAGPGLGYRLRAGVEDRAHVAGSLYWQNDYGLYALEAARQQARSAYRFSASGGLVLLESSLMATRRIDQSFALVQVPALPGVRIYAENQLVARSDGSGLALIPDLRAYQVNRLRIEAQDLPLTTRIGQLERR